MSDDRHPIWQLADELQKDLRTAQARLVELRSRLASLDLPDQQQVECPDCGLRLSGPLTLSEHRYHSHAGPEPQHWIELAKRVAPDAEEFPEMAALERGEFEIEFPKNEAAPG